MCKIWVLLVALCRLLFEVRERKAHLLREHKEMMEQPSIVFCLKLYPIGCKTYSQTKRSYPIRYKMRSFYYVQSLMLISGLTLGLTRSVKLRQKPNKNIRKKQLSYSDNCFIFNVVPPGIEPGTQGFSVLCSTN